MKLDCGSKGKFKFVNLLILLRFSAMFKYAEVYGNQIELEIKLFENFNPNIHLCSLKGLFIYLFIYLFFFFGGGGWD